MDMQQRLATLHKDAKEVEKETLKYFQRLKKRTPKTLDLTMRDLHDKEFEKTDCLTCANCCKTSSPIFTEKDIQFNLAMGSTFNRIATIDSNNADVNMAKSIEYYRKVLSADSNNFSANYNLGIIYYNKGVEIVKKMDYGLDLDGLTKMQDELFEIFRT